MNKHHERRRCGTLSETIGNMKRPDSLTIRLFIIGFISILGQVALLRELIVAFYGVELIYTLAIGVWLIFSGIGTIIGIRQKNPSSARVYCLFLLLSIAIPIGIAFIRAIRILFYGTPGAYLPLHIQILAMSISLLPFGLFLGLLFRWTARAHITKNKTLASAYAIESFGGIAGGFCATLFLKFGVQNFLIGLLCALLAAVSAFPITKGTGARLLRSAAIIAAGIFILCSWNASSLDQAMTSWTHPTLLISRDSPYSRITVTLQEHQIAVFENDTLLFDSEGIGMEEFVHLSTLQHLNPEKVLVLGGGVEGIVAEVQAHSPHRVDYVELNQVLLDIARTRFPKRIRDSLKAENVRVLVDDPRRFLKRASDYDLILAGMPEPSSGQANRFYTQEFFQQCAAKLEPDGILAFRLPSSENFMSAQTILRMKSVFNAAQSAFTEVMVLPGTSNIFLCSASPLIRNPSVLAGRMHSRDIQSGIVTASYLRYVLTNNRFQETAAALEATSAPMNTDSRPICYQYTLMIWLSKFMPSLNQWNVSFYEAANRPILFVVWSIVVVISAAFLLRSRWELQRTGLMVIAGFAGMVLETTLLLRFQIKNGVLFQDVGILLTSFMIGLVLGAIAVGKAKQPLSNRVGIGLSAGFIFFCGFIGFTMHSDSFTNLPATFLFLMVSGFLVAGTFAYTGLRKPEDQRKSVTVLYSADLIGGGLGSLLASLAMVPIAGLSTSIFLLIPLTILSLLLALKR